MYLKSKNKQKHFSFVERHILKVDMSLDPKLIIKKLKKQNQALVNSNKRLQKTKNEYRQVIEIQKDLIKEYVPKIKKSSIDKSKQKNSCFIPISRLLSLLDFPKSTYYHVCKPLKKNEQLDALAKEVISIRQSKFNKCYGRVRLFEEVNKRRISMNLPLISE
jgi:hypothetical protein